MTTTTPAAAPLASPGDYPLDEQELDWLESPWCERQAYLEQNLRSVLRRRGFSSSLDRLKIHWRQDPPVALAGRPMGRAVPASAFKPAAVILSSNLRYSPRLRCLEVLLHEAAHLLEPTGTNPHSEAWQRQARELARENKLPIRHFDSLYQLTHWERRQMAAAAKANRDIVTDPTNL